MNAHVVFAVLVSALCIMFQPRADAEDRAKSAAPSEKAVPMSWDSAKARNLWEVVRSHVLRGQDAYFARIRFLRETLRQNLSKKELAELAASCATMPDEDNSTAFLDTLYAALFEVLCDTGDRDGLVTLLAARFPENVYPNGRSLESYVADLGIHRILVATNTAGKGATFRRDVDWAISHGYSDAAVVGKKDAALVKSTLEWFNKHKHDPGMGGAVIEDPILIVADAFSKSKLPPVRKAIAGAMRNAFMGLGVVGKNDDEFVANAIRWYGKHKDRIEINLEYGIGPPDCRARCALFRLSPSADVSN